MVNKNWASDWLFYRTNTQHCCTSWMWLPYYHYCGNPLCQKGKKESNARPRERKVGHNVILQNNYQADTVPAFWMLIYFCCIKHFFTFSLHSKYLKQESKFCLHWCKYEFSSAYSQVKQVFISRFERMWYLNKQERRASDSFMFH